MSYDVNCPYCDVELEINHDDGYGYDEDQKYTQVCSRCGKVFIFTTTIILSHEAEIAPCQNGEPHNYEPIKGAPSEFFVGRKRCSYCDEEIVDQDANNNAISEYFKRLEEPK